MVVITTESGSVYMIDTERRTWSRVKGRLASPIRVESGEYQEYSAVVGSCMIIVCPSLTEGYTHRVITTSPVVSIKPGSQERHE